MDCIFCKIVKGELPSTKIYEDDRVIAFKDINPVAPVHILIIPRDHIQSAAELNGGNIDVVTNIFVAAETIAKDMNLVEEGYRIVTNIGENGGQIVPHLHFHLIGGRKLNPSIG